MIVFLISLLFISPLHVLSANKESNKVSWESLPQDASKHISRFFPDIRQMDMGKSSLQKKIEMLVFLTRIKMVRKSELNPRSSMLNPTLIPTDIAKGILEHAIMRYPNPNRKGDALSERVTKRLLFASVINDSDLIHTLCEDHSRKAPHTSWYEKIFGNNNLVSLFYVSPAIGAICYLTESESLRSAFPEELRKKMYWNLINATTTCMEKDNLLKDLEQQIETTHPKLMHIIKTSPRYTYTTKDIIKVLVQRELCKQKPYDIILPNGLCEDLHIYNCNPPQENNIVSSCTSM